MNDMQNAAPAAHGAAASLWDWVKARRAALRNAPPAPELPPPVPLPAIDDPGDPQLWGLALSGGGIRSATFGLGVISGLARNGIFSRFDLLSTVSGGGYAGSAVGKLYAGGNPAGAKTMQSLLARMGGSWFVWWLRATSRYLTPRGAKDLLPAVAMYLRNLFAIHLELALAGLAFGALVVLSNLAAWWGLLHAVGEYPSIATSAAAVLRPWVSSLWLPIAFPLLLAISLSAAYWTIPSRPTARRALAEKAMAVAMFLVGALALAAAYLWPSDGQPARDGALRATCAVAGVLLVAASFGPPLAWLARPHGFMADDPDAHAEQRNRLTRWLSVCIAAILTLFILGVLDRAAWFVAFEANHYRYLLPVVVAIGLAVFRTLAAQLQARDQAIAVSARLGFRIAELFGLLLFALLLVFWMSVVYRGALASLYGPAGDLHFTTAGTAALQFLALPLAYMVFTGTNGDFPNLSSMHMFYRARLMRSFLGAGNPARFPPGAHPLDRPDAQAAADAGERKRVFEVDAGDNVRLADYRPHEQGGPVHIVNATVNQTLDPLGGLFNQDRKGQYLSITSFGQYRIGVQEWQAPTPSLAGADLPTWMAISGAAVSPGLGGQTSTGLALLLFMSGVRLGFWWDMGTGEGRVAPRLAWTKYDLLWNEARARFGGTGSSYWYLTDGGHFENTAAYALLRERAQMIVVSDAGADPDFQFQDLENLVRKARIDLRAEINFIDFPSLKDPAFAQFGSIEQLRDPESDACIALARVRYDDGRTGWLAYIKPNMFSRLPIDVVNYRKDNPAFPQEPTTDQFFSESQWESYFKLGQEIARQLDAKQLADIAAGKVAALNEAAAGAPQSATPAPEKGLLASRVSLRTLNLAKSGLSLTAVLAIATTGFQAWQKFAQDRAQKQLNYSKLVSDAVVAKEGETLGKLVVIATQYCPRDAKLVQGQAVVQRLFHSVEGECRKLDTAAVSCDFLRTPEVEQCFNAEDTRDARAVYWAVDYSKPMVVAQDRVAQPAATIRIAGAPATAASTTASGTVAAPKLAACKGKVIYIQIYDAAQMAAANSWSDKLKKDGARVPGIENVTDTAKKRGQQPPQRVSASTAIYHTEDEHACASGMMEEDPKLVPRPLTGGLQPTPGVVELWLPPDKAPASK